MARRVRIEYPGAVYHVICRGNNRQSVLRDDHDRQRYLEKLSLYCKEKEVDLLAYRLLTHHVHVLLETPNGNLSKMMQPFQTSYPVYFTRIAQAVCKISGMPEEEIRLRAGAMKLKARGRSFVTWREGTEMWGYRS